MDLIGQVEHYNTAPQKVGAIFVACLVLHNITTRHECLLDTLQDLSRRDAGLHVPMPMSPNTTAAAQALRDQLARELRHL